MHVRSTTFAFALLGSAVLGCGQIAGLNRFESTAGDGDGDADASGGSESGDGDGDGAGGSGNGDGDGDLTASGGTSNGDGDGDGAGGGTTTGGAPGSGGSGGSGGTASGGNGSGGDEPGGCPGGLGCDCSPDPCDVMLTCIQGTCRDRWVHDGYGIVGAFRGELSELLNTAGASTIQPYFSGDTACINGTLAEGTDEWAAIRWNLNQDPGDIVYSAMLSGDGIRVEVLNVPGTAPVRIEVVDESGTVYCANLELDGSGRDDVLWTEFNTECSTDGPVLDLSPSTWVRQIGITVYQLSAATPFQYDVCWNHAELL